MIGDSMPGDKRISIDQASARSAVPGGARFTAPGGIVSPTDTPGTLMLRCKRLIPGLTPTPTLPRRGGGSHSLIPKGIFPPPLRGRARVGGTKR